MAPVEAPVSKRHVLRLTELDVRRTICQTCTNGVLHENSRTSQHLIGKHLVGRSSQMIRDALDRIPVKPEFVELPASCIEFLHDRAIPADIVEDLARSALPIWFQINSLTLLPMPELVEQNTATINDCIDNGFLALAGGSTGDPVVVDRRDRRMYYVSHDLLWSDRWSEIHECLHPTPYVYEDFWLALVDDARFPWDYYEAQRRWPTPGS